MHLALKKLRWDSAPRDQHDEHLHLKERSAPYQKQQMKKRGTWRTKQPFALVKVIIRSVCASMSMKNGRHRIADRDRASTVPWMKAAEFWEMIDGGAGPRSHAMFTVAHFQGRNACAGAAIFAKVTRTLELPIWVNDCHSTGTSEQARIR